MRSGPFLSHRAGGAVADRAGRAAHAGLRLVQPGGIIRHRRGGVGRRCGWRRSCRRWGDRHWTATGWWWWAMRLGRSDPAAVLPPVAGVEVSERRDRCETGSKLFLGCTSRAAWSCQAVGAVLAGCLRGRVCRAEHRGLLVPRPLWRGAGVLGSIFFGANILAGISALSGGPGRQAHRADQHDGVHAPPVEYFADPGAAHARRCRWRSDAAAALQHLADGRTHRPVVHDGGGRPDERSAAAGVTGIARTTGAALSPVLTGLLLATPALSARRSFWPAGLKIVYDLLLYRSFRRIRPPEEK